MAPIKTPNNDIEELLKLISKKNYEPILKNNYLKDIYFTNDLEKTNKIGELPTFLPEPETNKTSKPKDEKSLEEKLSPLDSVFIDPEVMEETLLRLHVPELVSGFEKQVYSGIVLRGPPGTGKSVLVDAVKQVYENFGAYAKAVSASEIHTPFVGEFAKNLEKEIKTAINQYKQNGKPSLLVFDEGSAVGQKAEISGRSVRGHYQEVIDVFKRYLGNPAGEGLVVAIITNEDASSLDSALTREGRLKIMTLGNPGPNEIQRMWAYFAGKEGYQLTDSQASELTDLSGSRQGAFIVDFCQTYKHRQNIGAGKGSLLENLKKGVKPKKEKREPFSYNHFKAQLEKTIEAQYVQPERKIGF